MFVKSPISWIFLIFDVTQQRKDISRAEYK